MGQRWPSHSGPYCCMSYWYDMSSLSVQSYHYSQLLPLLGELYTKLVYGQLSALFCLWSYEISYCLESSLRQSYGELLYLISCWQNLDILSRFISNRMLLSPPSHSTPADSFVEYAYVFDVHTNAFFPLYLTLYLAQLFLLPIVVKDNWVCLWLGNTLYLAA